MTRPRATLAVVLVLLGGATGAVAGAWWYATRWLATRPYANAYDALVHVERAWIAGNPTLHAFVFGGTFFAILVVGAVVGYRYVTDVVRAMFGVVVGGAAGIVTYAIGYVAASHPGLPSSGSMAFYREAVLSFTPLELYCVALGAMVGVAVANYSWRFSGVLTYVAMFSVVGGYVVYTLVVTLPAVPPGALPLSALLFVAETASLVMVLVFSFYNLDVSARKRWKRDPDDHEFSRYYVPKVAFHLATYNEPPEMVLASIRSLLALDYPSDRLLLMVLDDSTEEQYAKPIREACQANGITYQHRTDRRGYKAGALNEALRATPPDVELVAVVDADYQVEPEYLRETVGHFIDPQLGFIQTPQDYRNPDQSFLTRQYYYADAYFYRAILPSRNEENAIIFCGTMGIIRRSVLEEVGGWAEDFVTEDAELSARILERGYTSLYINRTYGRGLIPPTFDGYKKQHYRWAFGGVQILRAHLQRLMSRGLSRRQAFDFFVGGIHWFDGVYIFAIAMILTWMALADLLGIGVVTHHSAEIWLVGLIPIFLLVEGISRIHLALKRNVGLPLRGTLRVMGMWYSIKWNNTGAALRALFGAKLAFVRTPKGPDGRVGRVEALRRAMQLTRFESTMAGVILAVGSGLALKTYLISRETGVVGLTRMLLLFWLTYYVLMFLAAPIYAYKSYVTYRAETAPAGAPTPA